MGDISDGTGELLPPCRGGEVAVRIAHVAPTELSLLYSPLRKAEKISAVKYVMKGLANLCGITNHVDAEFLQRRHLGLGCIRLT